MLSLSVFGGFDDALGLDLDFELDLDLDEAGVSEVEGSLVTVWGI